MIISASRRTDIPAFYSEWFYNRLSAGEVLIKNPFNRKQVSRVTINKESVDCFVFWTKNPKNMMGGLELLEGYKYYFQFTLTSYGQEVERNVVSKNELIKTFIELSKTTKVIWRYDPILLNEYYTKEYHYKWFESMASKLSGYTDRCVISFVDDYKEVKKNKNELLLQRITAEDMVQIASNLSQIANKYGMEVYSCAEKIDLSAVGVKQGQCIDPILVSDLTGKDFRSLKKDKMREGCQCVKSVDIGEYNSCLHGCAYCYANYNSPVIQKNHMLHNPKSKILISELQGDEKITNHFLMGKKGIEQLSLF